MADRRGRRPNGAVEPVPGTNPWDLLHEAMAGDPPGEGPSPEAPIAPMTATPEKPRGRGRVAMGRSGLSRRKGSSPAPV